MLREWIAPKESAFTAEEVDNEEDEDIVIWERTSDEPPTFSAEVVLKTYTDEPMQVRENLNVRVKYGSQEEKLVLVVVEGDGPSLFGRNWLKHIYTS